MRIRGGLAPFKGLVGFRSLPLLVGWLTASSLGSTLGGYSFSKNLSVSVSGGTAAVTYTVIGGALPANVTLSTAGVLSGTPSSFGGSYSFTVRAAIGPSHVDRTFTLSVTPLVEMALSYYASTTNIQGTFGINGVESFNIQGAYNLHVKFSDIASNQTLIANNINSYFIVTFKVPVHVSYIFPEGSGGASITEYYDTNTQTWIAAARRSNTGAFAILTNGQSTRWRVRAIDQNITSISGLWLYRLT